jgi:hypothetical protein
MRKQGLFWTGALLLSASVCWAQGGPDKVCEVNVTSPKPGGASQLEGARKKHNEFHKTEKDKWGIMIWEVGTGPAQGSYLSVSCGMGWKDLDREEFDKRDAADRAKTLSPFVGEMHTSYYVFRQDLSTGTEAATPAKMMTVVHYFVKPSGILQFNDAIKRINAAVAQTKYPSKPTRWYALANGGEGPHFVAVVDRNSFADMQGPEQTMADMLKQAYGADDKTLQSLREAVDHTVSELLNYRADLSYVPAK